MTRKGSCGSISHLLIFLVNMEGVMCAGLLDSY